MYKIVKIGLIVLSVIGFICLFMMPDKDMPMADAMGSTGITIMFGLAYLLMIVAVISTLIFGLKNMGSSPGGLKKAAFSIVGLIVALGIAYGLSSGTDISVEDMMNRNNIETTEGEVKLVGAGIYMFYIMLLAAVGLILWGGIKKATSK